MSSAKPQEILKLPQGHIGKNGELLEWIDTHCHIDYDYPFDEHEYLKRAASVGVKTLITIGANKENWTKIKELSHKYSDGKLGSKLYFTVGTHPHDGEKFEDSYLDEMKTYAAHPSCVAIGELGLDYYYDNSPRELQKEACRKQLDLALELKKPVIIHSRDGEDDLLVLLKDYAAKLKGAYAPGVIHCFSGTEAFGSECLKLGFYISFSGIITFKKAEDIKKFAAVTPLDRILVETDAPYLAPIPYRGKQNESALMVETCKVVAEAKGISIEDLSQATMANTKKLFRLT